MSNLDLQTIEKLTELCAIKCTKEECESLLNDLKNVLDYIELLEEVDTENVSPCNSVLENISNVMREDSIGETMPRDLFLENTAEKVGGMIKVPTIIKQG